MPPTAFPWRDFAIALFLGALIGVEREKTKAPGSGARGIGGIRTFTLFSMTGAVAAWLSGILGTPWILIAAIGAVVAIVAAGYLAHVRAEPASTGVTTEIAAVVTCLLGAAAATGHSDVAVPLGIVTSALLAFRGAIHGLVGKVGEDDLFAVLKLLLASFVVLPLLPDRTIDPWDAVNPYRAWWLVVLISGLSLLGYVAVRMLGTAKGFALTGLFGGLVSSTAVTLSFAKKSREEGHGPASAGPLAAGVFLAWTVMFARVVVTVSIVCPQLLPHLWKAMAAMGAVALVCAVVQMRGTGETAPAADVALRNPFQLTSAVKFALGFTAMLVVVKAVQDWAPTGGIYAVAALAGSTDVDAITLSMADFAKRGGGDVIASTAVVIAVFSNTAVKAGMAATMGHPSMRRRVLVAATAIAVAGVLGTGLTN